MKNALVLFAFCSLAGCATTDVPKPLIGEVRTEMIRIPIPVPCVELSKLPKRPASHAAPAGSDAVRQMAGVTADARDLAAYATELEAELRRCSTIPTEAK